MSIDRTPKPCLHKIANHQHGDRNAYVLDSCRCLPCCAANSTYETHRHRQQAYGRTPSGLVDAGSARAHVEALQAAGMGWKRVAVAAGVSSGSMSRLLYGKPSQSRGPSKRIRPDMAKRILAVPLPQVADLGGSAVIDGTGTRRRLQALVAAGWTQSDLAARLGMSRGNFSSLIHGHQRKAGSGDVVASTHRAVAALYDELWDVPGPETYGRPRALQVAAERGWPSPLAWDDDSIDDPDATPYLADDQADDVDEHAIELVLDGQPMRLTGRDLEEAVYRLAESGCDAATIAGRVRSDETTVRRIRNTMQQRAARAATRDGNAA